MLLSAVSVLVVAQSSSEIPEGLMNNPVLLTPAGFRTPHPSDRSLYSLYRLHYPIYFVSEVNV